MSKFYSLLFFLIIIACGTSKSIVATPSDSPEGLKGNKNTIVSLEKDKTSKVKLTASKRISKDVSFLASDALQGRDTGSEGIVKAANYIEQVFKESNIKPYFKSYKDTLLNYEEPAFNIVGYIEGNDEVLKKEYIIIGAHYDHIGVLTPVNEDAIANGANDNASGTAMVLELARYFGAKKTNKRSVIFALFSAEEKGLLGSKHLAVKLKQEKLHLYTMLNFEMLGVPLVDKDYLMYITGYEKSNLAAVCNTHAKEKLVGYLPAAKGYNLFQRSDNYPFYEEFNVPSHTFCTFDFTNFNHYHGVGDEAEIINFGHMASLFNKMRPVLENIINAVTKEIK